MRSTAASAGANATHSATASSAPGTSPDGDETPTSASSSRSAWRAISIAACSTQASIGCPTVQRGVHAGHTALRVACSVQRNLNEGGSRMSTETFVNYWIGQEPTPPSPPLDAMPAYVDVAPLAFVNIDENYELDFNFLCTTHPPDVIQGWIKTVRAKGTKVLFSINGLELGSVPDIDAFVDNVVQNALDWGVDGIDFDYEGWGAEP